MNNFMGGVILSHGKRIRQKVAAGFYPFGTIFSLGTADIVGVPGTVAATPVTTVANLKNYVGTVTAVDGVTADATGQTVNLSADAEIDVDAYIDYVTEYTKVDATNAAKLAGLATTEYNTNVNGIGGTLTFTKVLR